MARKGARRKSTTSSKTRLVFDSIRKPNAPPGHPLSRAKPDEVARPSGRKAKHKTRPEITADE